MKWEEAIKIKREQPFTFARNTEVFVSYSAVLRVLLLKVEEGLDCSEPRCNQR